MNITLAGATGFIGKRLLAEWNNGANRISVLSRGAPDLGPGIRSIRWDAMQSEVPTGALEHCDALVHLAGEPVAQRWTPAVKERILASRVQSTRLLVNALSTAAERPHVFICASAIGIYGDRGEELLTESSAPGEGFLAHVTQEWERQAELAEALGIRVVRLRIGVVLGREGGALKKMLQPFRAGVGGRIASGKQWMSWIHIDDLCGVLTHALMHPLQGPVNATSPSPVTNADFTAALAHQIHRPALFPVPAFALQLLFGEMATVLLASQRVLPQVAQSSGYRFHFPQLNTALADLL